MKSLLAFIPVLFSFLVSGQGSETFTNISTTSSSYTTVNWTGDNGIGWTATDARTDETMTAKCIIIRNGQVTCNGTPNGIGSLSFKHKQFFTGSNPVLEVRINGVLIGSVTNITSSIQTATFNNINVTGAFNLEIKQTTSGLRIGVDDISWTAYSGVACSAPTAQPTNISFSSITNTTANVTFTATSGADKYLAIRSTSSTLSQQPANGTSYSDGDALGNGVVAYSGANNNFVASDLLPGTTYYFFIYSFNDLNCSGGPAYYTTAPLTGSTSTTSPPACVAPTTDISNLQLTASSTSINGSFNASSTADGYLVVRSTSSSTGFTPTNGVNYSVGDAAGSGTVIKNGTGTTFVASGLNASTAYYFFVYPVNNFNCTGGPIYRTASVNANTTTTASGAGDWPSGYYTYADGKSCSSLKTALRQITDNSSGSFSGDTYTHNPQSYDRLWDQYKISDIKPREVGSGSANVIWDIYSDNPSGTDPYNYTPGTNQCGNYSGEASCYNREHSFPKSWFNDASPMYSDYHHLFPTDGYVNGRRSNYKYGEVASATWTSLNGSKLGSSATAGITGPVFEPINEYKGDVARAYLYMVTRYENLLPTWNGYATEGAETLDGSVFPGVEVDYLKLMIKWHNQDPVSQKERNRNNGAYSFQGNRNPFVDHPEYVEMVWNASCPGLAALPVDLISFGGKLKGNTVELSWDVVNEIRFDRYEVERSFNGVSFNKIGEVTASNRSNYSYNDNIESNRGRRIYYRLKKVDKDGKFSYSAVFSLHISLNTRISVYPNPASSFIKVQINSNINDKVIIEISDLAGRVVSKSNFTVDNGLAEVSTKSLISGSYFVKLTVNGETFIQKIQVIK